MDYNTNINKIYVYPYFNVYIYAHAFIALDYRIHSILIIAIFIISFVSCCIIPLLDINIIYMLKIINQYMYDNYVIYKINIQFSED